MGRKEILIWREDWTHIKCYHRSNDATIKALFVPNYASHPLSFFIPLLGHVIPRSILRQGLRSAKMTASNTAFTVFSGIGFFLSVVPLWWHLQSWNAHVGTSMYLIWTALACLVFFVDSIVWNGNAINWAPVWCDIGMFAYPFPKFSDLTKCISCSHSTWFLCRVACMRSLHHSPHL